MVQCGNVMVLVCRSVFGRMQTNAHCLLQSHAFPGPQNLRTMEKKIRKKNNKISLVLIEK